MDERRTDLPRHRALKEAKVVLSNWTVVDCIVRELSKRGARLEFGGPTELPKDFRVLLRSSNLLIPAEAEWQRGLFVGVRFTGPGRVAPPRKW